MMSKKGPQLRFEGFTDDWEERKLKDVLYISKARNKSHKYGKEDVLSVSREVGTVNQIEYQGRSFAGSDISNYKVVQGGELIYTKSPLKGAPYGIFQVATLEGILSPLYAVYNSTDKAYTPFVAMALKTDSIATHYLSPLVAKGAKNTINVTDEGALQGKIKFPNILEQKQIFIFFKQLDHTIALHQRKLDLLKEQKKGYLQKMFPKNGAKVPELRFAGFADDWEERKLSSMTNYKNGKSHEDKQSTSGKLELINLNSISISGGLKYSGKFIDEADDTLQKDDLVMILSDVGHGDLLGRVALIPEDDRFVLNQRVALLRPNTTADPQFLFSYINAHQYYFKAQGAGMSQLNISKGSVENFISFVPIIEEQKKIGAFYKRLDDTIALHQRKLDLLKEQKKGFLQKMFV
ncbi:restriction endonuclease subunit S [Streptococcus suis]